VPIRTKSYRHRVIITEPKTEFRLQLEAFSVHQQGVQITQESFPSFSVYAVFPKVPRWWTTYTIHILI
jgi:hypothetical protein